MQLQCNNIQSEWRTIRKKPWQKPRKIAILVYLSLPKPQKQLFCIQDRVEHSFVRSRSSSEDRNCSCNCFGSANMVIHMEHEISSWRLSSKVLITMSEYKNRSAMRTCVAYEIQLLFSAWCLIGFLLEELISDYHSIVFNIYPINNTR